MPATAKGSLKRRVFEILEIPVHADAVARFVDRGIVFLIVVNLLAVVLETVPAYKQDYETIFLSIEIGTVACFAVDQDENGTTQTVA